MTDCEFAIIFNSGKIEGHHHVTSTKIGSHILNDLLVWFEQHCTLHDKKKDCFGCSLNTKKSKCKVKLANILISIPDSRL